VYELDRKPTEEKINVDFLEEESNESVELNADVSTPEESAESNQEKEYLDRLQRLQAEFINYKKRVARDQIQSKEAGRIECISSLLPVLDDFDRMTENHHHISRHQAIEGIRLIRDKLYNALMQQGLKPIESVGQVFDPNIHEAVATAEKSGTTEGEIIEEWQKGYVLNETLLRPAKVKVAKSTPNESDD
jgi:molecular chaperone GrpE